MKVCSPDYIGMNKDEAVQDFMRRIEHYNDMYEPLDHTTDKDLSYIQIFNQGERFLVHKLAGTLSNTEEGATFIFVCFPSYEDNIKIIKFCSSFDIIILSFILNYDFCMILNDST